MAHLLRWVTHHDAMHGGRVPLPDSIIIEKAKQIAAEANHNNIKHTNFHGEGEAANLVSIAIVR